MNLVKQRFGDLQKSLKENFSFLSNRLTALESRSQASGLQSSPISEIGEEEHEAGELSVAPGSQERDFLSNEEDKIPSTPQGVEHTRAPTTVNHHSVSDGSLKTLKLMKVCHRKTLGTGPTPS